MIGVAKGVDRDAGKEEFHRPGQPPMALGHRDPVLYFVQRLRDEAHRFAIGAHRAKRAAQTRATPLDEVPGVGAARKRALLAHFGSAKAVTPGRARRPQGGAGHLRRARRGDLRLLPWRGVTEYMGAERRPGASMPAMRWTIPNILTVMRLAGGAGVALRLRDLRPALRRLDRLRPLHPRGADRLRRRQAGPRLEAGDRTSAGCSTRSPTRRWW